jgi:hypothetical protein
MNLDVLLSIANCDLSGEPLALSVPDIPDRFWLLQFLNGWNDVPLSMGTRGSGGKGGNFALVGPDWQGDLPTGLTELRMPTAMTNLGGRIRIENPAETTPINALQDQFRLMPLSAWGTAWQPPAEVPLKPGVDAETPVPRQVLGMTPSRFFGRLNALLTTNPAYPADAPVLERIAALGIAPGAAFPWASFSPEVQTAIGEGIKAGQQQIRATPLGEQVHGWMLTRDMGRFGTNYPLRAAWTLFGVGGNLVEDACYPLTRVDAAGEQLDGGHRYRLRFAPDELPPVNAFWSMYIYNLEFFFVDNPIDRYMLGSRSHLAHGDDGSLTIAVQRDRPTDVPGSNWLPGPAEGGFEIPMRLYLPKPEVAAGRWRPPAIERVG